MAYIYHRNRNGSDDHSYQGSGACQTYESVLSADSEFTNEGYEFVEWNFQPDGSANDVEPETPIPAGSTYNIYAIWTPEPKYIVSKSELKSIADAIRAKTGYSGTIAFPSGMVSRISGLKVNPSISASKEFNFTLMETSNVTYEANDVIETIVVDYYLKGFLTNANLSGATFQWDYQTDTNFEIGNVTTRTVNGVTVLETIPIVTKTARYFSRFDTHDLKVIIPCLAFEVTT